MNGKEKGRGKRVAKRVEAVECFSFKKKNHRWLAFERKWMDDADCGM